MKKTKFVCGLLAVLLVFACFGMTPLAEEILTEGDYQYTVADEKATVTGYLGDQPDVTVPSHLGGFPVTAIESSAFARLFSLKKIVLPEGLLSIGEKAFASDIALESIVIPNTVTFIGDHAFDSCEALRSVSLSDSLTEWGIGIFNRCQGVDVYVPATAANISDHAFSKQVLNWSGNPEDPIPIGGKWLYVPNRELTLWVYPDTEAQRHAAKHDIPFVTIIEYTTDTMGDIDGNNQTNAADALLALQHCVRLIDLQGDSLAMGDLNADGKVDALDALHILQITVGL